MTYDIADPTTYPPVGTGMWHLHHEILCEPLTEPLENRLRYIREVKSRNETPEQVALRLRLIRPIVGTLPADQIDSLALRLRDATRDRLLMSELSPHD